MVKPGEAVTTVNLPGDSGIGHQWLYLPDVARTMVQLLEQRDLFEPFATVHVAGHWDSDGINMSEAVIKTVVANGSARPKVEALPWWSIT